MKSFIANLLIITSVLLLIYGSALVYQRNNPKRLSFDDSKEVQSVVEYNKPKPTKFFINSQEIDLPIVNSRVVNNNWETTNQGVSYLSNSAYPGEVGNSIFYGHNWTSLLGRLVNVKPGDIIEIQFDNTTRSRFEVVATTVVKPNQTAVLNQTPYPLITVYTCTGFLDSKRFVVSARPIA